MWMHEKYEVGQSFAEVNFCMQASLSHMSQLSWKPLGAALAAGKPQGLDYHAWPAHLDHPRRDKDA